MLLLIAITAAFAIAAVDRSRREAGWRSSTEETLRGRKPAPSPLA
jgi:hypothetical protein